jgi:hypothetical protein
MTYKYWNYGNNVAIFRVEEVPEHMAFHCKILNLLNAECLAEKQQIPIL